VFDAVPRWLSEASRRRKLGDPDRYQPPPWRWGIDGDKRRRFGARGLRLPRGRGPVFGCVVSLAASVPPLRRAFFSILLVRFRSA
jgi:hypothetical protein